MAAPDRSSQSGGVENRRTSAPEATRAAAVAQGSSALLATGVLAGAITVYAALAVVVLLSAQHPRTWETWLVAVPAGLLLLSAALATPAARRRQETGTVREGQGGDSS